MYSGFSVELRFIPTQKNIGDLEFLVSYVARALPAVVQISIMNLEPKGWARRNWNDLYISPHDYIHKLRVAAQQAELYGINLRLFNYPLCHISPDLYDVSVKSISDWKNDYKDECSACSLENECCGFFSSSQGKFLDQPKAI